MELKVAFAACLTLLIAWLAVRWLIVRPDNKERDARIERAKRRAQEERERREQRTEFQDSGFGRHTDFMLTSQGMSIEELQQSWPGRKRRVVRR